MAKSIETLSAYEVLEAREILDIGSMAYILRHKKTGARVVLLSNDDENKVFYIGFRTTPADSTGVAHITEHSVLCGSKEFPVKDPFVELVKGSLNTFLNAMTYPDKTVYPVASCNAKDFQNLMHVYLDAVFYPNTYSNEAIFRQEGWHYEFDEAGKLFVNGVVYNEMKGAYSSADEMLEREIMTSLYPDTCYGVDSGGDPKVIPQLTYEQFLDFHRKYYHPSNSYIYLYGDMDMVEKLEYIDEAYLSHFGNEKVDSVIAEQPAFDTPVYVEKEIPLNEGEDPQDNTFLTLNLSIAKSLDRHLYLAFQILDYALCSAPGAVLKRALVEAGIGNDVYSIYENGIAQTYFSIVAKGTEVSKKQEFLDLIRTTLEKLVKEGFDKKALLAGIMHYEFQYREADFGSYPKGLMYGLQILDSWLYDDMAPFIHVEALDTFAFLKKAVETDYFEKLVQKYLLDNMHRSIVCMKPVLGVLEKQEEELAKKLAKLQAGMTEEELDAIRADFQKLKQFQEQEDSEENLACIPLLQREDLTREALPLSNTIKMIDETTWLCHELPTNGIAYLRLSFSMERLPGDLYPYAALLKIILGQVDTANYRFADLNNEWNLITGGVSMVNNGFQSVEKKDYFRFTTELKTKFLYENVEAVFALVKEVLLSSNLRDETRIYEILAENKSQMQAGMMASSHHVANVRAAAHLSPEGRISEMLNGISFYRFLADLTDHFDERKEDMFSKLEEAAKSIFRAENLLVDLTAQEAVYAEVERQVKLLKTNLYTDTVRSEKFVPSPLSGNEGFMTSGQVNYVCRTGNFTKHDLSYTGAMKVLRVIMGYQYLWVNVRVKGGAYGCMSNFARNGSCYFVSYRDPNLARTIEVYEGAPEAIRNFEGDERSMTQFIIGTFSEMDQPLNPAGKGARSYVAYMTDLGMDRIQKERDEVLFAQPDDIRSLAKQLDGFLQDQILVVVGNASKIKEEQGRFDLIENLF